MITIYTANGTQFKSVKETVGAKLTEALMDMRYVTLSWDDIENRTIEAGSYIDYNGERFWTKEPYKPTQVNEQKFTYTPKFYDKTSLWSTQPFFLVTETGVETDFQFTGYPGQFLDILMRAIEKYAGETLTYTVDSSIAQAKMETLTFQNVNIFQGANMIANKFGTEWWRSGNVFHLSRCETGSNVTLEVGKNIKIPSITKSKEGYYTRYYAFGSTRNIPQDYDDMGFTNGIVNKRLTLNPSKYTGGYIDVRSGLLPNEIFPVTLIFDDIYPALFYNISDVAGDPNNFVLDDNGNKIQIGEDAEGNPIYQQFTVWKFKIPDFEFNDTTYDKEDNPNGMLLPGKEFSVIFQSGQLNGREFNVIYDKKQKTYELKYIKDGGIIVPGATSLIPADGDKIALNNIRVESGDITTAQDELEAALREEMGKAVEDSDSRTFPSNPIAFKRDGTVIGIGTPVSYRNGSETLSTRVLKVESQIDIPEQKTITIGESIIKGNTEEIKEEVINANQNIDEAKALADLAKAITDGYFRVQQTIMNSLQNYRGLWRLNQNDFPDDPTKWTIDTDYTVFSAGDVVAYATLPFDKPQDMYPVGDYTTYGLFRAKQGGGLMFDAETGWYVDPEFQGGGGGIDEEQLKQYLTTNGYVTSTYLDEQGYVKFSSPLKGYKKADEYTPISESDTLLTAFGKLEKNFDNYVDLTTDQTVGGTKTFTEHLLSQKDVIAYATGSPIDDIIPIASSTNYGIVKIDGNTIKMNASGQLYVDGDISGGGGIDLTVGDGLELSSSSVLSVKYGTTAGTACQGNDSRLSDARRNPYSLSWSGYSSGSYDGSKAKTISIPNNTSQLTNGAGFIVDGNRNFDTLSGSGSSTKYLAGDGTFYTISYDEISGLSSNFVTINTQQTVTGLKTFSAGIRTGNPSTLGIQTSTGNAINGMDKGVIGNLYINYVDSSTNVKIDNNGNAIATGDVMAYSTGASLSSFVPVADTSTYGLVKYDGSTIGKNSSGQLYVIGGTGGGGGSNVSWSSDNGSTVTLSVDGSSKSLALAAGFSVSGSSANYRTVTIKGTQLDLSLNNHQHSSYLSSSSTYWGSSYTNYVTLFINNTSKNVSLNGHTHSNYLESSDIYSLTIKVNGSSVGTYYPTSSSKTINITTSGGSSDWNGGTISNTITKTGSGNSLYMNYLSGGCGISVYSDEMRLFINGSYGMQFYTNGTKRATIGSYMYVWSDWNVGSDIRLKNRLSNFSGILDKLLKIEVFRYTLKNDRSGVVSIGSSAQQLRSVFPELTSYDSYNDMYGIRYAQAGYCIGLQGVKELYTRFLPVETEVQTLKNKVSNLQNRLDNAYREIFLLKQPTK